jgi:transcriptional regulator with XRE-family HTH domain
MQTFAEKLKLLRERAGLTQAALAQQTGLSLGIVRDYEQGRKEPGLRSAFKLADALGVDCSAFKDCIDADAKPAGSNHPADGRDGASASKKGKGRG